MEKKDRWGLTEEEIKEQLRKLNQEKKKNSLKTNGFQGIFGDWGLGANLFHEGCTELFDFHPHY